MADQILTQYAKKINNKNNMFINIVKDAQENEKVLKSNITPTPVGGACELKNK